MGRRSTTRTAAAIALIALAALALPAAGNGARVAISDQHAATFSDPHFQKLHIKYARLVVSWDFLHVGFDRTAVDQWLAAARANHIRPLVAFAHSRVHPRRLPSARQYTRAFRAFRHKYPWVREYSPWNEANHMSQPTYHRPQWAARYFNIMHHYCPACTIVALDVLDQPDMLRYVQAFKRYVKSRPRIWGLHNYRQVNRRLPTGTHLLMRAVRGKIWLTETGGIVNFGSTLRFNPTRAAGVLKYLFRVAKAPRIKRLYIYAWWGEKRSARFDAGLVGPNGRPRPGYYVLKRYLHR